MRKVSPMETFFTLRPYDDAEHTHTHARTHASSVLKDENFSHPTVPFMPKPASLFYCQRFLYLSFSSPNVLSWIEMKNFYTIEPQKKGNSLLAAGSLRESSRDETRVGTEASLDFLTVKSDKNSSSQPAPVN